MRVSKSGSEPAALGDIYYADPRHEEKWEKKKKEKKKKLHVLGAKKSRRCRHGRRFEATTGRCVYSIDCHVVQLDDARELVYGTKVVKRKEGGRVARVTELATASTTS